MSSLVSTSRGLIMALNLLKAPPREVMLERLPRALSLTRRSRPPRMFHREEKVDQGTSPLCTKITSCHAIPSLFLLRKMMGMTHMFG